MLRSNYGEMIIKKDSVLYHTSDEEFIPKVINEKPMLFCTFHPSEYTGDNKYVHYVKIKRDISLLFMIEYIGNIKIYSSLSNIINHPNKNLAKKHNNILQIIVDILKKENFNGWFSSIENKGFVEVALINDKNIFNIIETKNLNRNWRNGNNLNNRVITKNWGKTYEICTIERPIILNIHERYKDMILQYIAYEKQSKYPKEYIFQVIIGNAFIYYFR